MPESLAPFVRRWYILLLGLAVTLGLTFYVSERVSERYEVGATLVMLPGKGNMTEGANPFLFLGSLTQARDVLIRSLNADSAKQETLRGASGLDYVFTPDYVTSGPLIVASVSAPTAAQALSLRDELVQLVPRQLGVLEDRANTPPGARFGLLSLSSDLQATANNKQQLRAVLAVAIIGVVLSLVGTGLYDGIARSVRAVRAARASGAARPKDEDGASSRAPRVAEPAAEEVAGNLLTSGPEGAEDRSYAPVESSFKRI